ncbi:TIR domain-containing protein [Pseudooceanicola sp. MF1-13]|uniref:TIR domain-containing protein n=1 Tax=Pseudooceanicola sp. MF1-13 TaxID=3379095 RepID=UPI0038920A39
MSIRIFLRDLTDLLDVVVRKRSDEQARFGNIDIEGEERRLNELIEDASDFAYSENLNALGNKLRSLLDSSDDGYGYRPKMKPSEFEARILRVKRVIETLAPDSDVGSLDEVPAETKVPYVEGAEPRYGISGKSKRVFVVHGHNDGVLHEVSRVLERIGLKPIVLREQTSQGRTIIEKFEHYSDVGFAVVLMTADDMGASIKDAEADGYRPRARQNVLLELGFFLSRLSRSNVSVLKAKGVEEPSDIFGVIYTEIDTNGAWKLTLGKELKASGYSVDLNSL